MSASAEPVSPTELADALGNHLITARSFVELLRLIEDDGDNGLPPHDPRSSTQLQFAVRRALLAELTGIEAIEAQLRTAPMEAP